MNQVTAFTMRGTAGNESAAGFTADDAVRTVLATFWKREQRPLLMADVFSDCQALHRQRPGEGSGSAPRKWLLAAGSPAGSSCRQTAPPGEVPV